jgi:preprotein translocase subunit YajC|tara:strand:+ start:188 stop:436 length:249 start_codon:yes stop_codon:yes gene_type:complete
MDDFIALLPLVTVFLIFYVILYVPQRRRQKKHKEYIESLKIGDDVVTESGIYGRVVNIKDESVTLVLKKGEIEIMKSKILHK